MSRAARAIDRLRMNRALNQLTGRDGWRPGRTDYSLWTRFRWAVEGVLCDLITNGKHIWGKPYPYREGGTGWSGRLVVRCRICRCVWSSYEQDQPLAGHRGE